MQGLYYGIAAGVAALASAFQVVIRKNKKISEKAQSWSLRIALYLFMAIFALRNLLGKVVLTETFGLNIYSPFGIDGQVKTLFATLALSLVLGILSRNSVKWAYPAFCALLFLPTVPIYYNFSAMIHATWYLVIAAVGLALGSGLGALVRKVRKNN